MFIFRLLTILISFIFFSCSTSIDINTHNTPFINSTETSKLDFDLTKEEVLEILGEPLIVKSGTGETKTIIWIYEVRTINVESTKGSIGFEPKKYNSKYKHDVPNHELELEFVDGKLRNWGPNKDNKNKKRRY